jgi:hypothetical protein
MTLPLGTGDGARVPIRTERTDHQIQSDIAALLFDIRTELQHIRATLATSGSVSSVQLEQGAKGDVRLTVKTYAESEPPVDDALDAFGRAYRDIAAQQMKDWADTLEMVQRERGEP